MQNLLIISSKLKTNYGINNIINNIAKNLNKSFKVFFNANPSIFFKKKINTLHIHGCWSFKFFFFFILGKLFKCKIVFSPHGMLSQEALQLKKFKKKIALILYQYPILLFSDLIIVNSQLEKKNINKIVKKKNIIVIPHGINVKKIYFSKDKSYKEIKYIFFSRIHPIKNINRLIDIWRSSKILSKNKLFVCGEISDYKYYTKIKKKISLSESINFIAQPSGFKKINFLSNFDVFILPSKSENFGLVILEALNAGLYIILNKKLDWHILKHKKYAELINISKKQLEKVTLKISQNQRKILSNKEKKKRISFIKNYDWVSISKKYKESYTELFFSKK